MSKSPEAGRTSYVDVGIEAIVPAFCTVILALVALDVEDWSNKSIALVSGGGLANMFLWLSVWRAYRQVRASKAHEDLVDTFK